MQHHVTIGPMAIGYLPHQSSEAIATAIGTRLWCPLHDDATHHWMANVTSSSPVVEALKRYKDGEPGSFVIETSSQNECASFQADFLTELEILKTKYERVEIVFGAVSYWTQQG
jgi:hypothetical protein